jgi:hypothetical protein
MADRSAPRLTLDVFVERVDEKPFFHTPRIFVDKLIFDK